MLPSLPRRPSERAERAPGRERDAVADGVGPVGVALGHLLDLASPEAVGRPLGGVAVGGCEDHAGAAEPRDGLGAVPPVEVTERRRHLDAQHEAAAELARFREPRLKAGHLVQGGELVEDHPDAPLALLGEREHGVDRDLEPGRDETAQARMLVAARGEEQEAPAVPAAVLLADPVPDREGLPGIGQELERGKVGREHGAHRERGLRVLGIDDRLRDRAYTIGAPSVLSI